MKDMAKIIFFAEKRLLIQPDVTKKFWESNEEVILRNYQYFKYIKQRKKIGHIILLKSNRIN